MVCFRTIKKTLLEDEDDDDKSHQNGEYKSNYLLTELLCLVYSVYMYMHVRVQLFPWTSCLSK